MKFVLEIHVVVTLCAYSVHTLSKYIRILHFVHSEESVGGDKNEYNHHYEYVHSVQVHTARRYKKSEKAQIDLRKAQIII